MKMGGKCHDVFAHHNAQAYMDAYLEATWLPEIPCNPSFRATGIPAYLKNGGRIELAQQIPGHESARTTGRYDRRDNERNHDTACNWIRSSMST